MSDIAIKVEGLGKKYVIGRQKSGDFRNAFADKIRSLLGRNGSVEAQEFWALQDINFEIKKGEAVGIIGRNGAGKSTLLKILSRITEPTKGRFEINGRVSSLLEVGTGFHMELTGRENIYLNGTILGMRRAEITQKLDEIIAFSGVEKFLDTPVKHYSSGMKVRLAFSVAAHLEPEILIIDEVLAVGDAEFQKKCLGKMDAVSKNEGRTVLFVSHNMGAVKNLCTKGFLLNEGNAIGEGEIGKVLSQYQKDAMPLRQNDSGKFDFYSHPNKKGNFGIIKAEVFCDKEGTIEISPGKEFEVVVTVKKKSKFILPEFGIVIKNQEHMPIFGLNNNHLGVKFADIEETEVMVSFSMPRMIIYAGGQYLVNLYFGDLDIPYESLFDAFSFVVKESDVFNSGQMLDPNWNLVCDPFTTISLVKEYAD